MIGMETQSKDEAREGSAACGYYAGVIFPAPDRVWFEFVARVGSYSIGGLVRHSYGWRRCRLRHGRLLFIRFDCPRRLPAVLAGAALSVSGLQMQTLFRNPLADPFVLGISAGASLGVAIVVLTVGAVGSALIAGLGFLGDLGLAVAAIIGAAAVLGCVLLVSRHVQSVMTLLILGLMFGYATGAFVSILIYFSVPEQIQSYILWTFGSFGSVTWRQMPVLISAIFVGLLLAFLCIKPLNALLLGENYARSMGLNVKRIRLWILVSASILAGATTAFCGPIAFLGLAVPHLCRSLLHTSDHRVLMPAVTCLGATLALLSDLIAHLPGSQFVLPLNAVTSLIGAPIVIWFILHRKNLSQAF